MMAHVNTKPLSGRHPKKPDRAFVYTEEGQRVIKKSMTPGKPMKLLPGACRLIGHSKAGVFEPLIVEVQPGQTTTVELTPKPSDSQ